jgi:hypothetical protein
LFILEKDDVMKVLCLLYCSIMGSYFSSSDTEDHARLNLIHPSVLFY